MYTIMHYVPDMSSYNVEYLGVGRFYFLPPWVFEVTQVSFRVKTAKPRSEPIGLL